MQAYATIEIILVNTITNFSMLNDPNHKKCLIHLDNYQLINFDLTNYESQFTREVIREISINEEIPASSSLLTS